MFLKLDSGTTTYYEAPHGVCSVRSRIGVWLKRKIRRFLYGEAPNVLSPERCEVPQTFLLAQGSTWQSRSEAYYNRHISFKVGKFCGLISQIPYH